MGNRKKKRIIKNNNQQLTNPRRNNNQQPANPQSNNQQPDNPQRNNSQPAITKKTANSVPEGPFFWHTQDKRMAKIAIIMDQHGEIFLVDEKSGIVYWSFKTKIPSYSLFLSKDVDKYIDFDAEMMYPFHHNGNLRLEVISFSSVENLKEQLEAVYRGVIKVDEKTSNFDLNYQTGSIRTEQTQESFMIKMVEYDTSFSSREPITVRWHLKFAKLEVYFPNIKCPCRVHHAKSLDKFIEFCSVYNIKKLPDGSTLEDLRWINLYRVNKIIVDPKETWENDKVKGCYEGKAVEISRIKKRSNTINKLRNLRLFDDDDNNRIVHFYGWQEVGDFYYVATELCESNLEKFAKVNNFSDPYSSTKPFQLDILREIAFGVFNLHAKGIAHGNINPRNVFITANNKPKLGLCSFVTDEEGKDYSPSTNMKDLGKLLLFCSSDGAYDIEVDVGDNELNLCKIAEVRDVVKMLTSKSPPALTFLMLHPWLWDTHTRISFIVAFSDFIDSKNTPHEVATLVNTKFEECKVFNSKWNETLDKGFLNTMTRFRQERHAPDYDYNRGSSLVRIIRNGLNHHEDLPKATQKVVGKSKHEFELYLRRKFPQLVTTLYHIGKQYGNAPNLRIYYEGQKIKR